MNVLWRGSDPDPDDGRKQRRPAGRGNGPSRRPQVPVPAGRPFRTLAFWALVILLSLIAYRMYQGSFMTPQRGASTLNSTHATHSAALRTIGG